MPAKRMFKDRDIEYYFERRRYGSGPSTKFFVWIIYRWEGRKKWNYAPGDPWPKVTPSKKEVEDTLAEIRKSNCTASTGDCKCPMCWKE